MKLSRSGESGFSLLEVLVSTVVVAVGVLGFLALQVSAINSNQNGYFRGQATVVADDIIARLRANRTYVGTLAASDANAYTAGNYNNCTATPPGGRYCSVYTGKTMTDCDMEEAAAFDVWEICRTLNPDAALEPILPGGELYIDCADQDTTDADACSSGSSYSVLVYWQGIAERTDVGQTNIALNTRCLNYGLAKAGKTAAELAELDCLIMDIVP